jgi:hypothetical protein
MRGRVLPQLRSIWLRKVFEAERNLLAATEYATFSTLTFTIGKLYLVEDFDGALERFQKVIELTRNGDFRTQLGGTLAVESGSLRELLEPEQLGSNPAG